MAAIPAKINTMITTIQSLPYNSAGPPGQSNLPVAGSPTPLPSVWKGY